ncbi:MULTISPECIES: hypothetical protein [Streptomyces]|uniref:hypothetical protein n=1 Tax=Streptomyces TaxID=1883 RepID=UPI001C8EB041|nr:MULTISPECIES: hypothetical protein [Streptomyces]WTD46086.1 hypothetical protein OG899_00265 [Streptomyces thermoviolaceus]
MESRVLIQHSPLMSWLCDFLSLDALAAALGTTEIVAAVLLALHPRWPRLSRADTHGFPVLSAKPGQFLLKDLVLLGVSLTTLGESLEAGRTRAPERTQQRESAHA